MADLDAGGCFGYAALVDPGDDVAGQLEERRLHPRVVLRTELHPLQAVLLCEFPALFGRHFSLLLQVGLIADDEHFQLVAAVLADLPQPLHQVLKGLPPS